MSAIPIVGGSYELRVRKADCQRSINLFPSAVESGSGKAPAILQSIPGLTLFTDLGAEVRGFGIAHGRIFAVGGNTLYEIDSAGVKTPRGTLSTSTGPVEIKSNLFQLIVTDGGGYVLTLSDNTFTAISDPAFSGSRRFAVLNGRAVFSRLDTRVFYWSAIDDALTFNALDFASAESTTDNVTAVIADHGQLFIFKQFNIEVWDDVGAADSPYQRNSGAHIETGCGAPFTIRQLDNTLFWLGQDERGDGVVWKFSGYTPMRVSNHALEEVLRTSTDLSSARAYAMQDEGHSFYALVVPGLDTTPVYDVETKLWSDRAEFIDGRFAPHRGVCHVFAFGKHLLGALDGRIFKLDPTANTNAGDVLVRERVTPHQAMSGLDRQYFSSFELDCIVGAGKPDGTAAQIMLKYSNDGGESFSNWRTADLGVVGQRQRRVRFNRCGTARDRVWSVRCSDNTDFAIIGASVT